VDVASCGNGFYYHYSSVAIIAVRLTWFLTDLNAVDWFILSSHCFITVPCLELYISADVLNRYLNCGLLCFLLFSFYV